MPLLQGCSRDALTHATHVVMEVCMLFNLLQTCLSREWEFSVLAAEAGGDKQSERVRSLFHRQLQVPLAQGPAAMAAYQEWEAGGEVSLVAAGTTTPGGLDQSRSTYRGLYRNLDVHCIHGWMRRYRV